MTPQLPDPPESAARPLVALALDGARHAPGSAGLSPEHWTALVRRADRGGLDFLTLDDSFAPPEEGGAGRLEALGVFALAAPATARIGLVPAVTTTHTEPFHVAMSLATLDYVSEGRAGWLVEVSATEAEARAFGRRPAAPPAELWAEAADVVEVAARLWDSWEDDAEIRDAATGRFVDRERLHYVDFAGPRFSVRGPSIVPRPPQGRPPVVVALPPDAPAERRALASARAEVVLLAADSPAAARRARAALRADAARHGRPPAEPRVLARLAVSLTPERGRGATPPPGGGGWFAGAPAGLVEVLAEWAAAGEVDGFHLVPASAPGDLPAVVDDVLPALRARGLAADRPGAPVAGPSAGQGAAAPTLRDRLRLPRPASRYAGRPAPDPEPEHTPPPAPRHAPAPAPEVPR